MKPLLRLTSLIGFVGAVLLFATAAHHLFPAPPALGRSVLATPDAAAPSVRVYFSPNGGCTAAIVAAIDQARTQILVQAYSFTSAPIAEALANARRRGVEALVCLDRSQRTEHYSSATFLAHAGIPVWIDAQHAIAHSKVMVIDQHIVISGSFNFTKAAETSNLENLLILDSPQLAAQYAQNWKDHQAHSQPY